MYDVQLCRDWVVAAVVATEVPPPGTVAGFDDTQVGLAIQAVCNVIRQRTQDRRYPNDPVHVVLEPAQFSAVCRQAYWRDALAGTWQPAHVAACLTEWRNLPPAPVAMGATSYYSPISMVPRDRVPDWAARMTEVLVPGLDREYFRFFK